jgi:predicted acylesterase/phospholipase RssA
MGLSMRLVLVTLSLLAYGCATHRPAGMSCGIAEYAKPPFPDRPSVAKSAATPGFNMLVLGAGGQYGAYGAGFLEGWSQSSKASLARSDVNVVTGVSAGALIATHAFLGRDAEIARLHENVSESDVLKERFPLFALFSDSMFDTSPKDAFIAKHLTNALIDEVAKVGRAVEAAGRKKRLLVGVVDFDSGDFLAVDLVALAASSDPRRYDCYREAVGASSSIPIAFSPKIIDGRMFVDGGTRAWMFIDKESLTAGATAGPRNVIGVVHGDLVVESGKKVDDSLLPILGRTMDVTSDQLQKQVMFTLDWVVRATNATRKSGESTVSAFYVTAKDASGSCRQLHAAAYQSGGGCAPHGWLSMESMFCQPFMQCLVEAGRRDGREWTNVVGDPPAGPFRLTK